VLNPTGNHVLRQPKKTRSIPRPPTPAVTVNAAPSRLLPLGALAAGFGLFNVAVMAQTAPAAPAAAASAPKSEATLPAIPVKAKLETDANSVRATTTTIGKGNQELRDIPQSVTIVTEKLIEDRRIDTLKEALHNTAGISFMAAEGGEEDIRIRGFSLAASGDIYVDGLRDPAFYDRDTFNYERIELLRGSASMLFGRGSTGGVVNQVMKQALLADASEVNFTIGSRDYLRFTGDFNLKTGDNSAVRLNVMNTSADNAGNRIDKQGLAATARWGIGTADEFSLSAYYLRNNNGINYGLPWLRKSSAQTSANPSGLIDSIDPKNYYGAASDYNAGGAAHATAGHTHRFAGGGELKSSLRHGRYDRDQRASAIRFCVRAVNATTGVVTNPNCPTAVPAVNTINDSTLLNRGTNNKVQDMTTTYAQSDYSHTFNWFGLKNEVLTGVDLAHEVFHNYATVVPTGVTLDKNTPRTTIGTPNDGTGVDEAARIKRQGGYFDAKALGVYAQDLIQVAPMWKILGGLRYDYFKGDYRTYQTATSSTTVLPPLGSETAARARSDGLWSKRFGVLFQPTDNMSYHFSYGTSFNTSGDTYQYDDQTKNTPPEGSVNLELGAKLDAFDGRLSTRLAIFRSTKNNERNRDPDSAATQALLSGKRHTVGVEIDIAGRITSAWEVFGSYAWTPVAKIDIGAPGSVAGVGEGAGTRSSLTPRHSGTFWSTVQISPALRFGAGLNARSAQTPNRNPAGVHAPRFVTGDLLAEYTLSDAIGFKLNVNNVTNKLYGDSLYTGHYVAGAPRTVQVTMSARF
jgi:catecholate siderophore receptor